MRRVLIAFLALLAAGLLGTAAVAVRIAWSTAPTALAAWALAHGATVTVDGGTDFAFLPSPRAVAHDVRLSIPGFAEIRTGTLEIVAHPATLLQGRFVPGLAVLRSAAVVLGSNGSGPASGPLRTDPRAFGPIDVADGRLIFGGGFHDLALAGRLRGTADGGVAANVRVGGDGAVTIALAVGPVDTEGSRSVRVEAGRGVDEIRFEGRHGAAAGGWTVTGRVALGAPGLAQTLAALALPEDLIPVRAAGVTATVRLDGTGVAVEGIQGQTDIGDVSGAVAWEAGGLVVRADAGRVPVERLVAPAIALARSTVPLDVALRLAGITFGEIDLGVSSVTVRRTDGVLVASLAEAALFDGSVGARLESRADAAGKLSLDGSVRLNGVDLERLLRALGAGPAAAGDLRGRLDWRLAAAAFPPSPGGPGTAAWTNRLIGDGTFVVSGGRIGVGVFGLGSPLPVEGLSGSLAMSDGRATLSALALVAPPQRFAGRGAVDLSDGTVDIAFAPVGGEPGRLPSTGFRLRGRGTAAGVEPAPVAIEGPLPTFPARPVREEPRSPPTPLPAGAGRGG